MKVLVVGATGGSGRATVEKLLAAGHEVTAFSRHADRLQLASSHFHAFPGDVMNPADVEAAVPGHDAVIVTLGISESPLRVRLFGSATTPMDVRSTGTRNVISAMRKHGVRKLVVQTTYGVGATKERLRWVERLMFKLLLQPQIADTERQEREVRASGLDWVLAQPVHLTDSLEDGAFASSNGETRKMRISRRGVAQFLVDATAGSRYVGQSVALSGA